MLEVSSYSGEERRSKGRREGIYSKEQALGFIVRNRFKEERPENLAYPHTKFAEDGPNGEMVEKTGADLRCGVSRLFDDLEEKALDSEKIEKLRRSFEASIAPWEEAGLFSQERLARGFKKPDFTDYQFGVDDLAMMEAGPELNRGYNRLVWTPKDVPFDSEDPNELTFLNLLKEALIKAYRSSVGGKRPNTLLVGPERRVLTADRINLEKILFQSSPYQWSKLVHNPQELTPCEHGAQSDKKMLKALRGMEQKTGGVLRLERDQLIMPSDIGQEKMSGRDWHQAIQDGKLPKQVRAQDARQAIAYVLHCLNTEGWVPDCHCDWTAPQKSGILLAPETYLPSSGNYGTVPEFFWNIRDREFVADIVSCCANFQHTPYSVRGGMRKNNEAA